MSSGTLGMGAACALLLAGAAAIVTAGEPTPRFELSATATQESTDVPVRKGGPLQVRATLGTVTAPATAPAALVGGNFVLTALTTSSGLVCYYDTIFRDGFDGTGL